LTKIEVLNSQEVIINYQLDMNSFSS